MTLNLHTKILHQVFSGALFADDLVIVSTSRNGLKRLLKIVEREGSKFNMKISTNKSKIMVLKHTQNTFVNAMPMNLDKVLHYK